MIILILMSIPLLDGSTWFSNTSTYDMDHNQIIYFATYNTAYYQQAANLFVSNAANNYLNPLLYFQVQVGNFTDTYPDNYSNYLNYSYILANTRQ
jgi:hypothetical protein